MNRGEELFDATFRSKLKAFYSFDEGNRREGDIGYRRTGRTTLLARVLLETAIESGNTLELNDHYCRRGSMASNNLAITIRDIAHSYEALGIHVDVRFHNRNTEFSANITNRGYGVDDEYEYTRIKPAPLPTSKPVINNRLLLITQ